MDIHALQERLQTAGYDPGEIDGAAGPHTFSALCSYVAGREIGTVGMELGQGIATYCADFSALNLAHFLGQGAHETGAMRWLMERGGPAYCARYDGNKNLGNTEPGDGFRFRGRGFPIHLTGRANYAWMAKETGLDLLNEPDLAAEPANSVRIGAIYWHSRGIDRLAEADDIEGVTRKINGGVNGLDSRKTFTTRAKEMLRP